MGRAHCTLESAVQEIGCPAPGQKVNAAHPSSLAPIFLSLSPTPAAGGAPSCPHEKHQGYGTPKPSVQQHSHLPWC